MTSFRLNMDTSKYLYQNAAEIVDSFAGCLLDNFLAYSEKAVIALFEEYQNEWNSVYKVYHARIDTKDAKQIENLFYTRQAEAEAAY